MSPCRADVSIESQSIMLHSVCRIYLTQHRLTLNDKRSSEIESKKVPPNSRLYNVSFSVEFQFYISEDQPSYPRNVHMIIVHTNK